MRNFQRFIIVLMVVLLGTKVTGQVDNDTIDLKYLEDQLYLSFNYNLLQKKVPDLSQRGFSGGFSLGFIKDIPMNQRRNAGIGLGVGYSFNVYVQNLKVVRPQEQTLFSISDDYQANRMLIHALDFPFELRFRTSTPTRYKFWRIYPGFRVSHLFSVKTKHRDDMGTYRTKNVPELVPWQYGMTFSVGYSTWNVQIYYGLTDLFENALIGTESLNLRELTIAVKFYII
jgi:hypothetical protein